MVSFCMNRVNEEHFNPPMFHLIHLTHLIENRRASGFSLNFRFSINESSESGETAAHGVTFPSEAEMAGK